jgi:hypothetical protein
LRVEGRKQIPTQRLAASARSLQRDIADMVAGEIAHELNRYVATHSSPYAHVGEVLHNTSSDFEDNVAAAFIELQSDSALEQFAVNHEGRAMLDVLYEAIITGNVSSFERKQAERIITAKSKQIPPAQYIAQMKQEMIFPVRNIGLTRDATATFRATLEPNGKVKVHYTSIRVYQFDMFKEEVKTLPGTQKTMDGFELDPDQIVGVKLYDEGGITVHVPALTLIDFSNQIEQRTISKAETAFFTGLTFGAGGLGGASVGALAADVAAGQASKAALWAARGVLWADRIAVALPVLSTVVNEHRDWIVEKFPQAGPDILDALDRANSIAAYYGWARLGIDGIRYIKSTLRPAEMSWHAERVGLKDLSSSDENLVKGIDEEIGIVLDDLNQAETEVSTAAVTYVDQHPQVIEGKPGQRHARVSAEHEIVEVSDSTMPTGIGCEYHSSGGPKVPCPNGMGTPTIENQEKPAVTPPSQATGSQPPTKAPSEPPTPAATPPPGQSTSFPRVLSIGGEGEVPGAITINNLEGVHKPIEEIKKNIQKTGGVLVQADFTVLPIDSNSMKAVIGRKIPFIKAGSYAENVASEAYRVLEPGGTVKLNSQSAGGGKDWVPYLKNAGFKDVHLEASDGYVYAVGTK